MAQIIRARFMHQHKDRAVYEREIVLGTPSLSQYYGKPTAYIELDKPTMYFEFDMPLLLGIEPEFVKRWVVRSLNCRVTRRVLRLVDADGTILYELSKRPLKATLCITGRDLSAIRVCCVVSLDEAKKLSEIFFK